MWTDRALRRALSRSLLLFAAWTVAALPAHAQASASPASRLVVEGQGGWIGFADDGVINHGAFGVALPFRVVRRLSVGPELVYAGGPARDRDLFLSGNVWVTLGTVKDDEGGPSFSPYIVGGYGLLRHTQRTPYWTYSSTEVNGSLGAGLRVDVNDRWYVAPEWRIGLELHMRVMVAVGYRFGARP